MAPKKKGGGKKGKGKKKVEDWGAIEREQFVMLEVNPTPMSPGPEKRRRMEPFAAHAPTPPGQVRNDRWESMRFTQCLATTEKLSIVIDLIMEHHQARHLVGPVRAKQSLGCSRRPRARLSAWCGPGRSRPTR